MTKIGLNNTSLKQQNRGLVLKLVVTGECTSRIELSKKLASPNWQYPTSWVNSWKMAC